MANKTDERLLDSFLEASGRQAGSQDDLRSVADELTSAVGESTAAEMTPEAAGGSSTAAQGQGDGDLYGESGTSVGSSVHSTSPSETGSSGASFGSIATTFLESGMGIVPLVSGLLGLFGGGSSAPAALEKYAMPSSISFESADTGNGLSASDFDQMGTPRLYAGAADSPDATSGGTAASSSVAGQGGGTSGSGGAAASPQISVTVQTMDARSFLDNSDQIAQAVRGAMLNLSSINDVVNEL
jgi:hypothetical protein